MRAALCSSPGTIALHTVPEPVPTAGEVLVQVHACGVCGSDLHWFQGQGPPPAVCPGHEMAGTVVACGAGVRGVAAGDCVAVEPIAACGTCAACRAGRPQLCPALRILGMHRAGGFAERVTVPADAVHPLPASADWTLAALTEPTAVAVHGVRIAGVALGDRVAVLGGGTIGLLCVLAARAAGASEVWISARHPHQRAMAERLGAGELARDERGRPPAGAADVVLETVGGTADTLRDAFRVVRPAGTVAVLGVFSAPPALPALALVAKEVRVIGSLMYDRTGPRTDFALAIELLARHAALARELVTHQFPLDAVQTAFETAADKRSGAIKVLVQPAG